VSGLGEIGEACGEAVRRGGAVLRKKWGTLRTVEYKGEANPVTDADRASEAVILEFLQARFPSSHVLAEESGAREGAPGELRFYVDPLDGTTNYAHGVPQFAVTVGAEDRSGLAAGASYDPLREELFLAVRGRGATLNGESIQVTSTSDLSKALLCTGFPYDVRKDLDETMRCLTAVFRRSPSVRRLGSAALDLAYVACGRFDGFWEMRLKPWDLAPGILLVLEAGGRVNDFDGGDEMLARGDICAANLDLQPRLLQVLAEVRKGRMAEGGGGV